MQGERSVLPTSLPIGVVLAGKVAIQVASVVQIPLLSAILWPTALRRVLTLDHLWVFLAWANCLAGLMAIITTVAKMAMMPITTKSSIKAKPLCLPNIFLIFYFLFI